MSVKYPLSQWYREGLNNSSAEVAQLYHVKEDEMRDENNVAASDDERVFSMLSIKSEK